MRSTRRASDFADLALQIADLNQVSDVDATLQEQNQPGHEIRHHVLQTDPDADAERAGQDGDAVEVDAQRRDREDEPDEDDGVANEGRDGVWHSTGEENARVHVFLEDEAN